MSALGSGYWAHSHPGHLVPDGAWQPLRCHLLGTARLARQFAQEARPGDAAFAETAYLAGLLHDLGKYRPEFQQLIRRQRSRGESTRHKHLGAALAADQRADLAWAVAGHHGGLPSLAQVKELIASGRPSLGEVWSAGLRDCPALAAAGNLPPLADDFRAPLRFEMHVRLLFSCLVDADWLDTSLFLNHREGAGPDAEAGVLDLSPERRLANVLSYIRHRSESCRGAAIAAVRQEILSATLTAADRADRPGLFSMAVPTGGGKTLASLAFALRHAAKLGLRRIIYVAPYLSIIDQNAREIRAALGGDEPGLVLEHHSLAEPGEPDAVAGSTDEGIDGDESSDRERLLAENWDAPVVVTTSVQFLESLFAHQPRRCRKLHNVARSVVILDECQTLPPGLISPTCQMLQQLVTVAGTSVVLCTATQPAWHRREDLPEGLTSVTEIVPPAMDLHRRLRRVRVAWPEAEATCSLEDVARQLMAQSRALCVVNTRRKAKTLFGLIDSANRDGLFHLATSMCPAHRLRVIAEVARRLREGQDCRLVSTQLIEAGVDLDFPFAMRELAPLEAIVQAAGRCNREGRLNGPDGLPGGQVVVFRLDDASAPTDGWYRNGIDTVLQAFLRDGRQPDLSNPGHLQEYFRRLYRTGELDERRICDARRRLDYPEAAGSYRLIEENGRTTFVVASWEPARQRVAELLEQLQRRPSRSALRALAPFQVNIFPWEARDFARAGDRLGDTGLMAYYGPYDESLGLVMGKGGVAHII